MRTYKLLLVSVIALNAQPTLADHAVYHPPRLTDGRPDLQGVWDHVDSTPFERPPGITTLAITAEQAAAIDRARIQVAEDPSKPSEPTEYFNERRMLPIRGELHSSVIIDPEDGRIPGTAAFKQWQLQVRAAVLDGFDGPEQRPTSERCLGNPAAQAPILNNPGTNLRQIVQTRDAVLIVSESMHFARVVRLNAKHAPAAVTSWPGDSIGWWEGDTLVVETKHLTPSDSGRMARGITFLISPAGTVTERITRVSDEELSYVFTVDDPTHYTRPWTGETHFMRSDDQLLEFACHEGNYTLRFMLEGARANDQLPTERPRDKK